MGTLSCLFSPVACTATSLTKATLGGIFDALTGWIVASVQWLLSAAAQVLTSASEPTAVVSAANQEFSTLLVLAPPLLMIGLLVSTIQGLRHADGAALWRVYLGVAPASVLAIFVARPLGLLILQAVDQLSSTAAATVAQHQATLATSFTTLPTSTPGFGLFLLALGVVVGTWLLWCELIVRTVVLTLLLVLVPVIVPLSTFPSMRRVGWRLGETFLAIAASKFLIVVTLSLGLSELQSSSTTQIITGAVTMVLASCAPLVLLRIIPFVEASALHHLEGLRGRATQALRALPTSPVVSAFRALTPDMEMPGPPERPADLGIPLAEGNGEIELAPQDGEPPPPPIGQPRVRKGHVAYRSDEMGPVVGWHFDD